MAVSVGAQSASPVLDPIGSKSTDENVNLNFNILATDADSTIPVLSTSTLPTGADFTNNLDGTGTFDWTPTYADSGSYTVMFYAADAITSDVDSELVTIVVNNVNRLPVLASIGDRATDEGVQLTFATSASDPDGNTPVMTMFSATLPGAASYIDNGDGTGSFDWTPTFGDSGSYLVTFYATDSVFASAVDSEQITITVNNVNQYPVLASIGDKATDEGVQLAFTTSASDPDGNTPVMTMFSATLPGAASYVDNGDGTGSFDWTPTFGDSGSYLVTFYATDSVFATAVDSEQITITVNNVNQYPVLASIGDKATDEGVQLAFTTSASDPDGNTPVMTMASVTLPGAASYVDNGDGTGSFDWTPTFGDSGSYLVTFYATDSVFATAVDSEQITITVGNVNQYPVLASIGDKATDEGVQLTFTTSASDADGNTPIMTMASATLPGAASYIDNGD
ncbi:MAG: cadherin-like domain-containing protein, partial [candidate division Zixibacteria bacterium]|nr:cadherin-like domain-containing protein [candidate division Zixibacteria bacterium]